MVDGKSALIIANSHYQDPDLRQLVAPAYDAEALAHVLSNPAIGGFEVKTLLDKPSREVSEEIEKFFLNRRRSDLLLLYFSGHGIKDDDGLLYFATPDTHLIEHSKPLKSSAVSAEFIKDVMRGSKSRRQVLMLDCCYSGAFAGSLIAKGDKSVGLRERFAEGRGMVVITASNALQYSFEGSKVEGEGQRSVFTRTMIEGIESGKADLNHDGEISLDELYEYVYEHVSDQTPEQRPRKWDLDIEGKIFLAHSPTITPADLPPELLHAITNPLTSVRHSAIQELGILLRGPHKGLALAARQALITLKDDDSRRVATAAENALVLAASAVVPAAAASPTVAPPVAAAAAPLPITFPAQPAVTPFPPEPSVKEVPQVKPGKEPPPPPPAIESPRPIAAAAPSKLSPVPKIVEPEQPPEQKSPRPEKAVPLAVPQPIAASHVSALWETVQPVQSQAEEAPSIAPAPPKIVEIRQAPPIQPEVSQLAPAPQPQLVPSSVIEAPLSPVKHVMAPQERQRSRLESLLLTTAISTAFIGLLVVFSDIVLLHRLLLPMSVILVGGLAMSVHLMTMYRIFPRLFAPKLSVKWVVLGSAMLSIAGTVIFLPFGNLGFSTRTLPDESIFAVPANLVFGFLSIILSRYLLLKFRPVVSRARLVALTALSVLSGTVIWAVCGLLLSQINHGYSPDYQALQFRGSWFSWAALASLAPFVHMLTLVYRDWLDERELKISPDQAAHPPRRSLADLIGARGPSIGWRKAFLFLLVNLLAPQMLISYYPYPFLSIPYVLYAVSGLALAGSTLAAMRRVKNPFLAMWLASVITGLLHGISVQLYFRIASDRYVPMSFIQLMLAWVGAGVVVTLVFLGALELSFRIIKYLWIALFLGSGTGYLFAAFFYQRNYHLGYPLSVVVRNSPNPTLFFTVLSALVFSTVFWLGLWVIKKLDDRKSAKAALKP